MRPLSITACTLTNAIGRGKDAVLHGLKSKRSGLHPCDYPFAELNTYIGRVSGLEEYEIDAALGRYECRNNRLAQMALETDEFMAAAEDLKRRYDPRRIGVFLGTSTSGVGTTEAAYRERDTHTGALPQGFEVLYTNNPGSLVAFVKAYTGITGPGLSISTACSSSAKVFPTAYRYMQAGVCDAALVGGVDTLCLMTLYGFNSLELIDTDLCRPWDAHRSGINIGEGAGFALLEWADDNAGIVVSGYGESSDAHHMSTPHPEAEGAKIAIQRALNNAQLAPADIDYINLHGTATPSNDASEDVAIETLFGTEVACSSTKGWTGHTLGAAGIIEALNCYLALAHGFLPASLNTRHVDPQLHSHILLDNHSAELRHAMTNSFGFGGTNCSLVLSRR